MDKEIILCPICKKELKALLFMGVQPNGLVCKTCKILFDDKDMMPLARII